MRIIVGLGNPGEEYKDTRHNIGFMAVDYLADRLGLVWRLNKKFAARLANGQGLILVKPQTFMNNSGQAVAPILSYYKLLPQKSAALKIKNADLSNCLTVIHDDLDILLGKHKISLNSRSAGHKGAESIINRLKTKNFPRIRVGIKTPTLEKIPADKFVLQKLSADEKKIIRNLIIEITERDRRRRLFQV